MKILILSLLLLVGCATKAPKEPEPTPTKPIIVDSKPVEYSFKWDHVNKQYTQDLVKSIVKVRKPVKHVKEHFSLVDLIPRDHKDFIKVWPSTREEVIKFWGNILVEMSYWESKYKKDAKYREKFGVTSRGLFQMSQSSSNSYKCGFKTEQEIHDNTTKAIDCAVQVLAYWLVRDGCLACTGKKDPNNKWDSGHRGGGRYWAVFRGTREYTKKSLAALKAANK